MVLAVSGFTQIVSFVATAIGAYLGQPIEGLALGALVAALAQLVIFRWWLRRRPDRYPLTRVLARRAKAIRISTRCLHQYKVV